MKDPCYLPKSFKRESPSPLPLLKKSNSDNIIDTPPSNPRRLTLGLKRKRNSDPLELNDTINLDDFSFCNIINKLK